MVQVAVFDLDGTILGGESPFILVRTVAKSRLITLMNMGRMLWWGVRYRLRLPQREATPRELLFSALTIPTVEEVDGYILSVFEAKMRHRLRADAVREVAQCREEGMKVILISASFKPITTLIQDELGFDYQVSTLLEERDGHYTGEVVGECVQGEEKVYALHRLCDAEFGRGNWQLARAYGDHHSDRFLLAEAAWPFAVTPNSGLKKIAKKNNWQILNWS